MFFLLQGVRGAPGDQGSDGPPGAKVKVILTNCELTISGSLLMQLCTQGGRGPRGAPGPPGDDGLGLPGPKVSFYTFCLHDESPVPR